MVKPTDNDLSSSPLRITSLYSLSKSDRKTLPYLIPYTLNAFSLHTQTSLPVSFTHYLKIFFEVIQASNIVNIIIHVVFYQMYFCNK